MNIGVDLDEVVAGWCDGFIKFYNAKYGKDMKKGDFVRYNIWECGVGANQEEGWKFMEEFFYSDSFDEIKLIEGVREGLLELIKQKHNLSLITSRMLDTRPKTDKFLEKYLSDIPMSVFYSHTFNRNSDGKSSGKLKSEICRDLGINYFVEDCLDYARDCARVCKGVFLLDKPWNQEYVNGNIIRVNNWGEIVELIQKAKSGVENAN
jgi:uncharacterized HAD superfamily protein